MLKKTILVKGPVLSRSGYGEQARFALRALRAREDLFDIYLFNIPWGRTGQIIEANEERLWINQTLLKTHERLATVSGGNFDISLQVTVPNEFEKIAALNIGYTAGIETTRVAHEWIESSNAHMDKIITVAEHGKKVFENTKYNVQNSQTGHEIENWGLEVPVEVVNYSVRATGPATPIDIDFTTDKNFLVVSQWGPRKNVENTIKWFVEEFKDDEDVGLVLKTNTASDCILDRERTFTATERMLKHHCPPDLKCKVYVVHGDLAESQLTWLYRHPTMKALINIGHGEGFGLPLFEAACNGLPLVTPTWSGQMDFICKPNKKGKRVPLVVKVDYDLGPIPPHAVWKGILVEGSMWAYSKETSYKRAIRECLTKEKHHRNRAKSLQKYILENFTSEILYKKFTDAIYKLEGSLDDWGAELAKMEIL